MSNGRTSSEAVSELEDLRVEQGMTMSQFHKSLQPKKKKISATPADILLPSMPSSPPTDVAVSSSLA
jgi:hypothetical protein